MNTIKVKLATSGRVANLEKNFPLYCGQFQNVLLNIYVPTEMLAPNYEIQHFIGDYTAALDPTVTLEQSALQNRLTTFVEQNTWDESTGEGRNPVEGDVIFYTYSKGAGYTDEYYRAVYHSNQWTFLSVPYFSMGNFAGTNIKIGMVATETNGIQYKSKSYYCRYVKTFTSSDNIEYALYERKLPKEFTVYTGTGQNAPQMIINVATLDDSARTVERIITSQVCALDVLPSSQLDQDEPMESTNEEELWAAVVDVERKLSEKQNKVDPDLSVPTSGAKTVVRAINTLNADKQDKVDPSIFETAPSTAYADIHSVVGAINALGANKQEKTDNGLQTSNKNIVGAINEVKGTADAANDRSIENAQEIANIEAIIGTGEDFIGTLTVDHAVTDSELDAFVQETEERAPKGGDTVIVIQEIEGQTDKTFKYIYTGTGWEGYEIPPVETASNGTAGIVSGTYGVKDYNTLVNIVGGEIQNIYVKINGSYSDILSVITSILGNIADIVSGTTQVGEATVAIKDSADNNIAAQFADILSGTSQVGSAAYAADALKATQDALGNNIVNTYLTQNLGATKAYVQDYALPKEFNNVLYLSTSGFSETIPTTPASGIQFSATSSSIGETAIFSTAYTLENLKFQLSQKNSLSARFFVQASGNAENVQFKLSVYATKSGEAPTLLSVELLPAQEIPLELTAIDFDMVFSSLNNNVIDLTNGDSINLTLSVVMDESTSTGFDVYCNSTYPSRINLNTVSQTITYRISEIGQALYIPLTINDLTVTNGNAYFVTDNQDYLRLINNLLDGELEISIPDLTLVTGITDISNIYLNNIPLTSSKNSPAELADFKELKRENGSYLLFALLRNSATEIAVNAPNISTIPKTAKETKQVAANAWTADANIFPFEYSYTTTFSQDNTIFGKVTLIASPIILAKYGIVIGEISGTNVTFYAQELPTEEVDLTLLFENEQDTSAGRATDQYGNLLTDQYGVQLYLV